MKTSASFKWIQQGGWKACLATVYSGGKRWRKCFETKEAAETWVSEKKIDVANNGTKARALTDKQALDTAEALERIAGRETLLAVADAVAELDGRATLAECVAFWLRFHPDHGSVTVKAAAKEFLATKAKKSRKHQEALDQRLALFCEKFGKRTVGSLMRDEVLDWLGGLEKARKWCDSSWNSYLVSYKTFTKWASKAYRLEDVLAGVEKREVKRGKVEFLDVKRTTRILNAAEDVAAVRGPWVGAAVALLFFCGLRPTELVGQLDKQGKRIGGLTWNRVDVDGVVRLDADITKTNQIRCIDVSPNLRAWLAKYGGTRTGFVVPSPGAWKNARREVEAKSRTSWGQDFARHSWASHFDAVHRDRAKLESQLGHVADSGMLESHYRALVRAEDGKAYFSIMPRKGEP